MTLHSHDSTVLTRAERLESYWLPLLLFTVSQLIAAAMFTLAAPVQISPDSWPSGIHVSENRSEHGFWALVTNWDGQWYRDIALRGYPDELPRDDEGRVIRNQWAFYPLYPAMVRAMMILWGSDFAISATIVSISAGLASMLLIYRLFSTLANTRTARVATLGMCFIPLAPVYQMAYSESLALLLVTALLLSLIRGRYLPAALLILLLALTRPVGLPIAAALASWGATRFLGDRRSPDIRPIAALAGLAFAGFAIWPVTVAAVTGEMTAYVSTQRAWNPSAGSLAVADFVNLWTPWFVGAILAVLILLIFLRLASWGVDHPLVRAWSVWYVVYILAVVSWNVTAARYFILAYPVAWPLARVATNKEMRISNAAIGLMLVCFLGIQWLWIRTVVVIDGFSPYAP